MNFRLKIILTAFPFLLAAYIGFSMLPPILDEANNKNTAVDDKKTQLESLEAKLKGSAKVSKRKLELEADIKHLRSAVPQNPDLDLFTIDLEKMCQQAGVDLISIAPPSDKSGIHTPLVEEPKPDAKAKDKKPAPVKSDLQEIQRDIVVTGDYNGLQKLVHELETYQRALRVTDIVSRIPKRSSTAGVGGVGLPDDSEPGDEDEIGDPKQLFIAMRVTTYFAP